MTDQEKANSVTSEIMLADALLRLQAMENILFAKGIITKEEFKNEMKLVSNNILKEILKKANVPGDLDSLINTINLTQDNK